MNDTIYDSDISKDAILTGEDLVKSDIVSDLIHNASLPAPVSRNLIKVFSRLCSATVDIPVAYLEGKAKERRAVTQARISLIHSTSNKISEQMKIDPEYAKRAITQFGNKVLREQVNVDTIMVMGIEQLKQDALSEISMIFEDEIDDDWLENFDSEARKKSTMEMQEFFAKILAGEIRKPKSFSIKAIRLLGNLDKSSAALFQKFCSLCVTLGEFGENPIDARVVSLAGNAASNSLSKYGMSFDCLNLLNEYGLIISDYNSWLNYNVSIPGTLSGNKIPNQLAIPFCHQNRFWILQPAAGSKWPADLQLHGVALTRSGIELMRVVKRNSNEEYLHDIVKYFENKNLNMKEIEDPEKYFRLLDK